MSKYKKIEKILSHLGKFWWEYAILILCLGFVLTGSKCRIGKFFNYEKSGIDTKYTSPKK